MGKKKGGKGGAGYEDFWDEDAPDAVKPEELPAGGATKADAIDDEDDDDVGGGAASANKKKKDKKKKQQATKQQAKKQQNDDDDEDDDEVPAPAPKKAEAPKSAPAPVPAPAEPQPAADDDDDGDDDAGGAGGGSAADKKKKKKKKKGGEKAEAPAAAPSKKAPSAAVAALQARLAAQKAAEEETRRREEEERKRIEEIERQEREEEERKAAERLRKKEKEKAKRDQLKKEGKLLTPKQKAEKAAAEARMQAMIRAGQIKVEGLEKRGEASAAGEGKKKVVYASRKQKKGGPPQQQKEEAATDAAPQATEESTDALAASTDKLPDAGAPADDASDAGEEDEEDVKDDWDASSAEEEEEGDAKDDWDAESGDGEEKEKAKPAAKSSAKSNGAATAKETSKSAGNAAAGKANGKDAAAVTPKSNGKAKAAEDGSDDDDDDENDDDDDDEDDDDDSDSDSDSDSDDDSEGSDDGLTSTQRAVEKRKAEAAARRLERTAQSKAAASKDNLRSPICCILGHVDTGKTKLLDKIRQTNVQEGEAGGITQQIGATYFPGEVIKQKTEPVNRDGSFEIKIPGLLVIDTPGHESFTNLRTRGSSLCNIAILVVDIMHGLEQQTLESIRLLRDKKTPFIVALNKVDRLYGWKPVPDNGFRDSLAKQDRPTQAEFHERAQQVMTAFAEQGLNSKLYYENKNFSKYVSLVPTSAHTGEGIPDMLQLLVTLTQTRMSERLMYLSELECTVLEVKVIEGLGTTIDVVLSNGVLREGDKIVICGLNDAIVTHIRALLTPQPLKEMRVKGQYVHHKEVKAALGVKIVAPDLEKAVSGSRLLLCSEDDDEEQLRKDVMSDLTNLLDSVDKSGKGVSVQASTLGSLEALLEFLKQSKIPVNAVNIGPVYKKDVVRCSTMLEKAPEFACMLCFDVPVDKEAEAMAETFGIKVFKANIIYHLFDAFTAYSKEVKEAKARDAASVAVWPCSLRIIAAFAKRDPIILGCDINEGSLRVGTPLCVVKTDPETKKKTIVSLGKVTSLEINHKTKDVVQKKEVGGGVAVRIEHAVYESAKIFGRHFDEKDEVISMISRNSIDALKNNFWDGISNDEKRLMKRFKALLDIP
ncbi:hypothetical protein A4X13_0g2382 [Tilletia indica]|uniref:Eukaryotic translation initiation factor 5B n=1 Tax=Tilletia indica TaxID=43049 RepID=A0A177TJA4_9BASI|nr:hypothetical protein A4X13_0g2382 [Tilletia indica]